MHSALEQYYNPETWSDKHLREARALIAFKDSYQELAAKVRVGALEFQMQFEEALALGYNMLSHYFVWAPRYDNFTPVFTEIEFEVPIPGLDNCVYQGRVDLVVQDEFGYWIIDHKTTAQFGDTEWLVLDDQVSSYAWALQKQLGLSVRGVIYNQLRKKPPHDPIELKSGGFSRNKQQDTTFEIYLRALQRAGIDPRYYKEFLSFLKHNPKEFCRRTKVTFTQRQLTMIEKRIQQEAREMSNPNVQIYPSPSPMNCSGCRFFQPCVVIQQGGEPFMDDNYERRS
jgi:hypothetical protein